jgi:hypothetical protein
VIEYLTQLGVTLPETEPEDIPLSETEVEWFIVPERGLFYVLVGFPDSATIIIVLIMLCRI